MQRQSTAIHLAQRPTTTATADTWELRREDIPPLVDGQFLVAVDSISIDPAMRGWLDDVPSYIPPVQVGAVMRAAAVGTVVESRHPDFPVDAKVHGLFGVRDFAVSEGKGVSIIDTSKVSADQYLAALGLTGLTAYFGLLELGAPQAGETVVVSGAAGAVGSVVGQLAKRAGCTVIGTAGSQAKCDWLTGELGFDHAINYNEVDSLRKALHAVAPEGINLYFDNVGGEMLDAALANTARNARIICCGAIADYNTGHERYGIRNYPRLITHSLTMRGFTIGDFFDRLGEGRAALAEMLAEGTLVSRVHRVEGTVEDFPATFNGLFTGANTGKMILALN